MSASKLIVMVATAAMLMGSGAALVQTNGHSGGNLPPGIPSTGSQGTQNASSPSYGVSRSVPTGAVPSSNRYAGQGEKVETFILGGFFAGIRGL